MQDMLLGSRSIIGKKTDEDCPGKVPLLNICKNPDHAGFGYLNGQIMDDMKSNSQNLFFASKILSLANGIFSVFVFCWYRDTSIVPMFSTSSFETSLLGTWKSFFHNWCYCCHDSHSMESIQTINRTGIVINIVCNKLQTRLLSNINLKWIALYHSSGWLELFNFRVGCAEAKIMQGVDKETRGKVLMQNNS